MELKSPVFNDNEKIPARFTGEGENISPALEWSGVPSECRSFVLICEDPDAPQKAGKEHPYVHWLIYNLASTITHLPEAMPCSEVLYLPVRAVQGRNSFGNMGYDGPMPPSGHGVHRYQFTLYALSAQLNLTSGLRRDALVDLIQESIIDKATLIGTYQRAAQLEQKSA